MIPDKDLILAVHNMPQKAAWEESLRENRLAQLEEYKTACALSRGPDKSRSDFWSVRAIQFRNELQRLMGMETADVTNVENKEVAS